MKWLDLKLVVGGLFIGTTLLLAVGGAALTPHDPAHQDLMFALEPPGNWASGYLLGTDHLGRDILARMISGARVSMAIAGAVVLVSGCIGVLVGALSGYLGGLRDMAIQKIVETVWAFPPILLAIAVLAFFGQSLTNVIVALACQRWIPYCRVARAQALMIRSREYVAASKIMGAGTPWIIRRHILPNVMSVSIVVATFTMATAILAESTLSFLGLGVPPDIPTWGGMLAEGRSYITRAWWLAVFPGLAIFITVMGLNLLGDWLRDRFDPKPNLNLV